MFRLFPQLRQDAHPIQASSAAAPTLSNAPSPWRVAAFYAFAPISAPEDQRAAWRRAAEAADLRGTMIIAAEGVNGTLAGERAALETFISTLRQTLSPAPIDVKWSEAQDPPFLRLKLLIKTEIVTMGAPGVVSPETVGAYVEPRAWNALIQAPDVAVIDVRNDYETEIGGFLGAIDPATPRFRDFPAWAETWLDAQPEKITRVAAYCTGGIRCEKATAQLRALGVEEVFHLRGGILRYLEEVPEAESLWRGACFVFDRRVSVGHGLRPGAHTLCHGCRRPVSPEDRAHPAYVEGVRCPRCVDAATPAQIAGRRERQRQVDLAAARGRDHLGAAARPPRASTAKPTPDQG